MKDPRSDYDESSKEMQELLSSLEKEIETTTTTTTTTTAPVLESTNSFSPSTRLRMGGLLAGGTLVLTLGMTAPFVFARTPLPFMGTPSRKIRQALEAIPKRSGTNATFVDLGSGDGEAVYQATQLGYQAIGYELNYTLYLLSQFRRLFWKERSRASFFCQDFFQAELPPSTSVVMIFGVTPLMRPISERLATVLPQGSHVMSYRFRLPVNENDLLRARVVYDKEEMRIYKVV